MTDRLNGLIVTFKPDLREDDAQCRIDAIRLIDGVIDVRPSVADSGHFFAVQQARHELKMKIANFLTEILKA